MELRELLSEQQVEALLRVREYLVRQAQQEHFDERTVSHAAEAEPEA